MVCEGDQGSRRCNVSIGTIRKERETEGIAFLVFGYLFACKFVNWRYKGLLRGSSLISAMLLEALFVPDIHPPPGCVHH